MEKELACPACKLSEIKFYGCKKGHDFWRCNNCDMVFIWPIPINLNDIYSKDYFVNSSKNGNFGYTNYDSDKESMRSVFEKILTDLEGKTNDRRLFDVGAATGYFLDLAKKRGWFTAGTEISAYAAQIANERGHQVCCLDLDQLTVDSKFNVVTMWDVLEHVSRPREYITKAGEILNEGGLLAINTINRSSLVARVMRLNWHLVVPPEHLNYFSQKSLRLMLEQNDFEIVSVSTVSKKFSLSYILKTVHVWTGWSIWNKLSEYFNQSFWRQFTIPVNLFDNIYIIAKKLPNKL